MAVGRSPWPLGFMEPSESSSSEVGRAPSGLVGQGLPLGMQLPEDLLTLANPGALTPEQQRFLEIYNEQLTLHWADVHAQTLIAAFLDGHLPGQSAEQRLIEILTLTGKRGDELPGLHFEWGVIAKIGTASPLGVGDLGFRREFRDSIQYLPGPDGLDVPLHPESSNQVGHFLSGVHLGYWGAKVKPQPTRLAPIPTGGALSPLGNSELMGRLVTRLAVYLKDQIASRIAVGHELFSPSPSTQEDPRYNALASLYSASGADLSALEAGRFADITLDEAAGGSSYQDLFLTWTALLFGKRCAEGAFSSRQDAASWLGLILTDEDLNVDTRRVWQQDVTAVRSLIGKFRDFKNR